MVKKNTVQWLELESATRSILRDYRDGNILGITALRLIDEAFAIATRRGNELPGDSLPWESRADANPETILAELRKLGLSWDN